MPEPQARGRWVTLQATFSAWARLPCSLFIKVGISVPDHCAFASAISMCITFSLAAPCRFSLTAAAISIADSQPLGKTNSITVLIVPSRHYPGISKANLFNGLSWQVIRLFASVQECSYTAVGLRSLGGRNMIILHPC